MRYCVTTMKPKIGRPKVKNSPQRCFRFSDVADTALVSMAEKLGQDMTKVIERALLFAQQHRDFMAFRPTSNA